MKYIFWIILFLYCPMLYSQMLYPEVMAVGQSMVVPLEVPPPDIPVRLSKFKRSLPYSFIQNPAVRYALQNLDQQKYKNRELNQAVGVLLKYAENESLPAMVGFLKNYIATADEKERALVAAEKKLEIDSIEFYSKNGYLFSSSYRTYLNSDLKTLVQYIRNDSNYLWLRDISRDSVFMEVMNAADQSIKFWANTGKQEYFRFWAVNRAGDSIGTWIQVLPDGNNIRIYVDDDVYQTRGIEQGKILKDTILHELDSSYFKIKDNHPGKLQRQYWSYYSEVEAAIGQGYLSNWASGGENSLSFLTNLRYFFNYNKNKTSWENFVHYRLGFLRSGSEDIRKNEDRLEINSKLGQKAFKHWFYTAQLNIVTQLFNSYDYPSEDEKQLVANFMSPGYYTLSVGIDYKPNDNFSLYLSPLAGKWTWMRDTNGIDPTRYGLDEGKKSKGDAGARVELRNKFKIAKIMDVRNELILFSSYYETKQSFTADWKIQIDFKINYFMQASVYANAVYDENYSDEWQFKETLNLGVNFRF